MTQPGADLFDALRKVRQQSRRIPVTDDEIVQEFRSVTESFTLSDDLDETESRGLTYKVVPANLLVNGDFETDLASWTENKHASMTATSSRTSEQSKTLFGSLGALKLDITGSTGANQWINRWQRSAAGSVLGGDVVSGEAWVYVPTLNNLHYFRFNIRFEDAANAELASHEATVVAANSAFAQLKVENKVAPAGTDHIIVYLEGVSNAAGAVGKAYFDLVRVEKGETSVSVRRNRIIAGEFKAS